MGLEGGGTKTGCAVLREDGTLLAYAEGGPANLNFVSEAEQRHAFQTALEGALASIDAPVLALGYTVAGTFANWQWVLERLGNPVAVPVEESRMAFISTGAEVAHGVVVIAGTGSLVSVYQNDVHVRTVGGWGALLGDEGSAYEVAIVGLRSAVRAYDGRDPDTMLIEAVKEQFGIDDLRALIPLVYQNGLRRHEIARFAQAVVRVAQAGDAIARQILKACATQLCEDALACAKGLFAPEESFPVALTGGMFREPSPYRETFEAGFKQVYPQVVFRTPVMEPAVAVAKVALNRYQQGGYKPSQTRYTP